MWKKKDDDDGLQHIETVSHRLRNGDLIETIYNPEEIYPALVMASGNIETFKDSFKKEFSFLGDATQSYEALRPGNSVLETGLVKFPSELGPITPLAEIYAEILKFIAKYIVLPEDFAKVSAVYAIMTWVYQKLPIMPYLRVIGQHGSGKTRFLEVVGSLCYTSMFVSGSATSAALFRTIDKFRGTLVLDESDFRSSDLWADIVKILNAGYDPRFPVIRMEPDPSGNGFVTKAFYVFGPKIMASRERFGDEALESRSITQYLQPQSNLQSPIHLPGSFDQEALEIKNKLLTFRLTQFNTVSLEMDLPKGIEVPRVRQTILPLYAAASLIGGEAPEVVAKFGIKLEEELRMQSRRSIETDIIIVLSRMIMGNNEREIMKIYLGQLAGVLNAELYTEYSDRKEDMYETKTGLLVGTSYRISPRKVGSMVAKMGIKTNRDGKGIYISPSEHAVIEKIRSHMGITMEMLQIDKETEQILPM